MGTSKRRHRRTRRAGSRRLAALTVFALTFALAVVQGSSIVAFAGGTISKDGSAPVATDDDSGGNDSSGPAATKTVNSDDGGSGGGGTGAGDTAGGGGSAVAPGAQEPDEPGAPSGSGEQPILLTGNQNCAQVLTEGEFLFEYRDESPSDDEVDLAAVSGGLVEGTLVIEVDEGAQTFDFEVEDGDPVVAVVVKGGSNANLFDYRPAGTFADTDLHAPLNPENDQFYGLSHISFCFSKEVVVSGIDVEKTCPASVPAGEPIDYTITVENTGDDALEGVTVDDSILGDITDEFDFDFSQPFPAGEVATATVSHTPAAGEDSVENTVTAEGTGVDSETDVSDDDSCTTTVTQQPPAPAIQVSKGCPETAALGEDITYSITVTNTGDEDLEGVTVTDTLLGGDLSDSFADTLAVGAADTQTFDYTVTAEGPLVNEVTVSATGVGSGDTVTSTATCTTTVVGGTVTTTPPPVPPGPGTAFTGSEAGTLGLIALAVLGIGLALVAATRRWRSEDTV